MDKVCIVGVMEESMLAVTTRTKNKALESIIGLMAEGTKEIGKMVKEMVQES
jgi:uncharacterized protein YoaH (UPF0181 family)